MTTQTKRNDRQINQAPFQTVMSGGFGFPSLPFIKPNQEKKISGGGFGFPSLPFISKNDLENQIKKK
ncbi:hypothetical protein BpHYR1_049465 [Brachionus plicatilis]|uniref:Uncharacterized protein n=1 Tax=Brachionus plicatilis TaxID=10195 RepID=A0A3M7R564_BRAPC|nr:hypothetical protein BpHYR1_049465 [Brachionus plicatilis]